MNDLQVQYEEWMIESSGTGLNYSPATLESNIATASAELRSSVHILAHPCVYALVIDLYCDPHEQQLSEYALGGGGGSRKTPQRYGSDLELGR